MLDITICAEKSAIQNLIYKVNCGKIKIRSCRRLYMYIFSIGSDLKYSKPCCKCQKMLDTYKYWFSKIYYSTGSDEILAKYYFND